MARAWHAVEIEDVLIDLGSHPVTGLTVAEAQARLENDGPNEIESATGSAWIRRLFAQFSDALIWVLLAAAAVSGAVLGEWIDAGVILAIVLLNGSLGFVQESRAERALARLREIATPETIVVRSGGVHSVPTRSVVVGDVMLLEAGSRVGADARLIESIHLEVDEASLTGESLPEEKSVEPVGSAAALGDRSCLVFAGTSVVSGRARVVVVATGSSTELGRIAGALAIEEPSTPLQVELDRVGIRLGILAVATAAFVFLIGWWRGNAVESMFLTAVALAVAAIPEGLPAVVTITLSGGVQRMAERNAVVRRLPAVEALGAASVICTDKTGTITRNEIRVQEIVMADRRVPADGLDSGDERDLHFLRVAALCNDAQFGDGEWVGDPTEVALAVVVETEHDLPELRNERPRLDEFAFDSGRKRMTTIHADPSGFLLAVKGAPEEVIEQCVAIQTESGFVALHEDRRRSALEAASDLAARGWRTLALAYRLNDSAPTTVEEAERDLVLVAVVGMSDQVRPEAPPAVDEATRAGITVVMVTGDHEVTARSVASEVGILDGGDVMPGSRLRHMTAVELSSDVERYRVYSRIDPLDKVKIVQAWRARGHIVAMTGDGVNDAPALRASDIGVAMGTGTDVAREASAMVLSDDNFATIVAAVREGRSIFSNLRTVVSFLLGSNASEVLLMFFGFLIFGALGEPLLATQLLWINLITDGLPALALGVDPADPTVMDRGPDTERQLLRGKRLGRLAVHGAAMAGAGLTALVLGHYVYGYEWEIVRTIVFTTIVLSQLAYAIVIRRATSEAKPPRNRVLRWSVAASLVLQVAVVYLPLGQTLFDTAAIPAAGWIPVVLCVAAAALAISQGTRLRRLLLR